MSAPQPTTRRLAIRFLLPFLTIPIAAAAFAPPSDPVAELQEFERTDVLHPICRMIERSEQWHVVARHERPSEQSWELVAWHDGPLHPGCIDPCELILLEQNSTADAMILTRLHEEAGPCEPLELPMVTAEDFAIGLRFDMRFCSSAIAAAEDVNAIWLIERMLAAMVRKLDEPGVSLTSDL